MHVAPIPADSRVSHPPPRRRPVDHAFVELARGAHASLVMRSPNAGRRRRRTDAARGGQASLVIAVALMVVGGTTAAMARTTAEGQRTPPVAVCPPITYVVNPQQAPSTAVEVVHQAISDLAATTGITFRYHGTSGATSVHEVNGTPASQSPVVLLTWSPAHELSSRSGRPNLIGYTTTVRDARGGLVEATIHLRASLDLPSGFDDRWSWGGVVMHELGHLVGLEHSDDPNDLMYPWLSHGPLRWGSDEAETLRALAREQGCAGPAGDSVHEQGRR